MRTEILNIKSITLNGECMALYRGKGEAWFLHKEDAIHHRNGHNGIEALKLITGSDAFPFPYGDHKEFSFGSPYLSKKFREYLNATSE